MTVLSLAIATGRPIPCEVVADQPFAAAAQYGGLGPGPTGLLVAIWPDGSVLRATDIEKRPREYVRGRVSREDVERLRDEIEQSGFWTWEAGGVPMDFPELRLAVCDGERRRTLRSVPAPGLQAALTERLLVLALDDPEPTAEPPPGEWIPWLRDGKSR
jgi:hypothetical protein